jgi:hypothetical protein
MKKTCSRCKKKKPVEQFPWKSKAEGTRISYCAPCRGQYNREYYSKNPAQRVLITKRNRDRIYVFLDEMKQQPCKDCKNTFPPCAMEFDHLNPKTKLGTIARLVHEGASKERLLKEIKKCDLVCANCHRLRTCRRDHKHSHKTRCSDPAVTRPL